MKPDDEALVSTLQLLLSDKTDEVKRALFYKAFPDSFMIMKADGHTVQRWLTFASADVKEVRDMTDGSSPLGMIAVAQVRGKAETAHKHITLIANTLGLRV